MKPGILYTLGILAAIRACELILGWLLNTGFQADDLMGYSVVMLVGSLSLCFTLWFTKRLGLARVDVQGWSSVRPRWIVLSLLVHMPFANSIDIDPDFTDWVFYCFLAARVFSSLIVSPYIEETLFRGNLFRLLLDRGHLAAYTISTLGFLLWHFRVSNYLITGDIGVTPLGALGIISSGLGACFVYSRTRSVLTCVVYHTMGNAIHWCFAFINLGYWG